MATGDYAGAIPLLAGIARATASTMSFRDLDDDEAGDSDAGLNGEEIDGSSVLPLLHAACRVRLADSKLRLGDVRAAVDDLHEAIQLCELRTQWALGVAAGSGHLRFGDGFDDAGDSGLTMGSVLADPHGVWFAHVQAHAMLLFALVQRRNEGYERASLLASDALRVLDAASQPAPGNAPAPDPPHRLALRLDLLDCLGGCLLKRSLGARSLPVLREALVLARRLYGPLHPITARTLSSLSLAHSHTGSLAAALEFAVEGRTIYAATRGGGSTETKGMEEMIVRLDALIHDRRRAKSSFFQPKLPSGRRAVVGSSGRTPVGTTGAVAVGDRRRKDGSGTPGPPQVACSGGVFFFFFFFFFLLFFRLIF
jgi:hypothetical protein